MLERNKAAGVKWNLKGLLIGNGWISPMEQYEAYLTFAYAKGLVQKGSRIAEMLESQFRICSKEMAMSPHVDLSQCEKVLQDMLQLTSTEIPNSGGKMSCYNMYDIRLRDEFPSCGMNWPPDLESVTPYLRRAEVVSALHISPSRNTGWMECNGAVGSAFHAAKSPPSITFLPELLEQIPIVLFSGAEDLICNHMGTEALIGNMQWNGGKGFEVSPGNWAPRRTWTFEGENAGFWQTARNLTYVLFYNSSHMVPFDYARRTRDMLDRFMGVDVSSIGGLPTDSRLDGEKGAPTTVGDHGAGPGSNTPSQEEEEEETKAALEAAKWQAYRKSGEIVLVIVAVAAACWGYFVWRERRRAARMGYQGVDQAGDDGGGDGGIGGATRELRSSGRRAVAAARTRLEELRAKRLGRAVAGGGAGGGAANGRDLEAADFDESELDDLHVATPTDRDERYSVGGGSDDDREGKGMNGGRR